jgi:murein DD-endopeptidase MepM/ murein hydrolase activator NlpD
MPFELIKRLRLRVFLFSFFLVVSFLFQACGIATRPTIRPSKKPGGIYHVVRSGENLFRIGKAYDVPYQDLAWINGIDDPARIAVGQKIFVPGATRQLPVEIITPEAVSIESPDGEPRREEGREGFIWPVAGEVTSRFGPRSKNFHDGIDIAVPEGTLIRAVQSGEVIYSDQLRGYGNLVIVRHEGGFASVYSHNRKNLVREGQEIDKGEVIGEVGQTGRVSGPHLHFEIRRNNVARDPLYYLPKL